jgi:hypothetical protein
MHKYLRDAGRLEGAEVTPAVLDKTWVEMRDELRSSGAGDEEIRHSINGIGLSFGQILVERLGMEWVIATDSNGTDIAVRGSSGWVVYPRDVVGKRFVNDESGGFLSALYDAVAERSPGT